MSELIKVENIVKKYKTFTLDKISFNLEGGHIYGFVGENGSGKSTTMKAIADLIKVDEGNIYINGKLNKELTSEERESIGFTLDEVCLPANLKIQLINRILKNAFEKWDENKFFKYLKEFNIDENKRIHELSKGMKAKFNIIISLCHKANILILDEPMNGLDPIARDEFCTLLSDFINEEENNTILISSHIISDLEKICTDFIFIHEGKIILNEKKKILENEFLKLSISEEEFDSFDKFKIIRFKKIGENYDVLLQNNEENAKLTGVEKASAEDILIFLIKGKTLWKRLKDCF